MPTHISRLVCGVHEFLGGSDYVWESFLHVASFLDHPRSYDARESRDRKNIIDRLNLLLLDGAESAFFSQPQDNTLHLAAILTYRQPFTTFLSDKSRLNQAMPKSSWRPLHLAVQEGQSDRVQELIAAGAEKAPQDVYSRIPAYYTNGLEMVERQRIIDLLA